MVAFCVGMVLEIYVYYKAYFIAFSFNNRRYQTESSHLCFVGHMTPIWLSKHTYAYLQCMFIIYNSLTTIQHTL